MKPSDVIKKRINALETAQHTINNELQILKADLEHALCVEANPFFSNKTTKKIAEFFDKCGYRIVDCKTQLQSDGQYHLAKQLWKCYSCVLPLLQQLYKAQSDFTYSVESLSTDDRTSLLNFCNSMEKLKWLAYTNNKKILSISPSIPKEYRNFFNGGWLEAVNRFLIQRTLVAYSKERSISHKMIWNVRLKKKGATNNNSNDMELDIVVEINDRIYIFETKAGQVLCVEKWIDRSKLFTGPNCHYITCCMDEKSNPSNFRPLKLFVLQTLEQQFTELLKKDFPPPLQT